MYIYYGEVDLRFTNNCRDAFACFLFKRLILNDDGNCLTTHSRLWYVTFYPLCKCVDEAAIGQIFWNTALKVLPTHRRAPLAHWEHPTGAAPKPVRNKDTVPLPKSSPHPRDRLMASPDASGANTHTPTIRPCCCCR